MSSVYKVEFFSTIEDQKNKKWTDTARRPLTGEEIARQLQDLIDDRVHQGYCLQQITDAHTRVSDSKLDFSQNYPKPDGMFLFFVKQTFHFNGSK